MLSSYRDERVGQKVMNEREFLFFMCAYLLHFLIAKKNIIELHNYQINIPNSTSFITETKVKFITMKYLINIKVIFTYSFCWFVSKVGIINIKHSLNMFRN